MLEEKKKTFLQNTFGNRMCYLFCCPMELHILMKEYFWTSITRIVSASLYNCELIFIWLSYSHFVNNVLFSSSSLFELAKCITTINAVALNQKEITVDTYSISLI